MEIQWVAVTKIVQILDTNLHGSLQCHDMPISDVTG
jgi:hypothetical protein